MSHSVFVLIIFENWNILVIWNRLQGREGPVMKSELELY